MFCSWQACKTCRVYGIVPIVRKLLQICKHAREATFSILLGLTVIGVGTINSRNFSRLSEPLGIDLLYRKLQQLISGRFKRHENSTLLTIGILNGFLPCGLVYMGLAGSLTTGSIASGALYMIFFGLGTFPAMMVIALTPNLVSPRLRHRINKFIPVFMILFGLFLIYRGVVMGSGHGH